MLGLSASLSRGAAVMRSFIKDNLKLYLDFKASKHNTLKFPCEGSTDFGSSASNKYIYLGTGASLRGQTSGSICGWINASNLTSYHAIITEWNNSGFMNWGLWTSGQNLHFDDGGGTACTATSDALSLNTWHHVCITKDGTTITLYVDGVQEKQITNGAASVDNNGTGNVFIGIKENLTDDFLGKMANIGMWHRVLSIEEINSVMRKNYSQLKSIEKTSLVSWWALDSGGLSSEETLTAGIQDEHNAETLGAELSPDVDFTLTGTQAGNTEGTYWRTSITDGKFSIANGTAIKVGGGTSQLQSTSTSLLTQNKVYKVTMTIDETDRGSYLAVDNTAIAVMLSDSTITQQVPNEVGTHSVYVAALSSTGRIITEFNYQMDGVISQFSVKEVTTNVGVVRQAITTTSVYGGNAPVLPRAVDVAREGEAEAIGNGSAVFDGNDYIRFSNPIIQNGDNKISIAAWVYADSGNGGHIFNECKSNGEISFRLTIDGGNNRYEFRIQHNVAGSPYQYEVTASSSAPMGNWQHVAATADLASNTRAVYINGIKVSTTSTESGSIQTSWTGATDTIFAMGVRPDSSPDTYFTGKIAQAGIWRGILTQEKIQAHMESTSYATIPASVKSTLVDSEEINDGDFTETGTQATSTQGAVWETETGWTIGSGKATLTDAASAGYDLVNSLSSSNDNTIVAGKIYKCVFTIESVNAGSVKTRLGNVDGQTFSTVGTHSDIITASNTNAFRLRSAAGFTGSIVCKDISVKAVTNELVGYWGLDADNSPKLPDFNGSNNYVNLGRINLYQGAFSVSYWLYHDTNNATRGHFLLPYNESSWDSPYARWMIRTEATASLNTCIGTWSTNAESSTMNTGVWQHVAIKFDGTTDASGYEVWVDNVRKHNLASSVASLTDEGNSLYMGTVHGLYTGDTEMFDGFIHNVAFFTNTNISDANIASIYALGKDGDVRDVLTPQHYYNHSISNWASGSGGITDIVGDKSGTLVGTAQTLTAYKVNDLTNNGNDGDLK